MNSSKLCLVVDGERYLLHPGHSMEAATRVIDSDRARVAAHLHAGTLAPVDRPDASEDPIGHDAWPAAGTGNSAWVRIDIADGELLLSAPAGFDYTLQVCSGQQVAPRNRRTVTPYETVTTETVSGCRTAAA